MRFTHANCNPFEAGENPCSFPARIGVGGSVSALVQSVLGESAMESFCCCPLLVGCRSLMFASRWGQRGLSHLPFHSHPRSCPEAGVVSSRWKACEMSNIRLVVVFSLRWFLAMQTSLLAVALRVWVALPGDQCLVVCYTWLQAHRHRHSPFHRLDEWELGEGALQTVLTVPMDRVCNFLHHGIAPPTSAHHLSSRIPQLQQRLACH